MTETVGNSKHARFPQWLKITLGALIVVASFYFLITRLIHDWNQIPFRQLRFRPFPLIISFAIIFALHFPLYAYAWKLLLAGFGEKISTMKSITIMSVTQIGKYIPGKVWFTLGRISLANREGIAKTKGLVSVLVEAGFALLSAVLLLAVAVFFLPRSNLPKTVYLLFLLAPLCLVVIYPPVLNRILAFLLRKLKRPTFKLELSYPRLLYILAIYCLDWFSQALGCFILINSFYRLPLRSLPILVGGYSVSWILGFLSLVTPAGLGIREGIYTFALKLIMLEPMAIVSALLTRIWITIAEFIMALAFALFLSKRKKYAKKKTNPNRPSK